MNKTGIILWKKDQFNNAIWHIELTSDYGLANFIKLDKTNNFNVITFNPNKIKKNTYLREPYNILMPVARRLARILQIRYKLNPCDYTI